MYIKFKVINGGSALGGFGFQGAIDWAMTSAAANTATASSFTGSFQNEISDLIVVSNDEAGGWTNFDPVSSVSNAYNWGAGWEAPSPKTGRSFKKRFEVAVRNSTSSNFGNFSPRYGAYDSDRTSYIQSLTDLQTYKGATSTARRDTFFGNGQPKDQTVGYWNLSVTSKYVYLWPDSSSDTTTGRRFLAGAADLAGAPQYLLNSSSDNVASVGFYTSGSNSDGTEGTSTTTHWRDYIVYYFAGIDNGSPFSTSSSTGVEITQIGTSASINVLSLPWAIHPNPYFNVIDSNYEQYSPVFDQWGSSTGSLTPITIMNPVRGIPTQYLEGIYYYSPQKINTQAAATEWRTRGASSYNNRIIYDDRGDKYVLWHQYGSMHIKAIRAM
jgi:hypothetical protein